MLNIKVKESVAQINGNRKNIYQRGGYADALIDHASLCSNTIISLTIDPISKALLMPLSHACLYGVQCSLMFIVSDTMAVEQKFVYSQGWIHW